MYMLALGYLAMIQSRGNRINGKEFVFAVQDCKYKSLHFRLIMSNLIIIETVTRLTKIIFYSTVIQGILE